ncbi:MAG TPA: glycosyltransferase [Edaphobacter sp.]|nr:glycosyltransferase [Edaphobacter sp.]
MPLTILSVGYSFAPVGPNCVGGAEQVLTVLDQALVKSGNTSLVLACEGSIAAGKLFILPSIRHEFRDDAEDGWLKGNFQALLGNVLSTNHIDLIHMHGLDFYRYKLPTNIPVLVTLHLPFSWYPSEIWKQLPSNVQLQCVSETQRRSCLSELCEAVVIGNGVEVSPEEKKKTTSNFAVTLGRICPEKNQHAALEAGSQADTPVILGGQVFPWTEHKRYFCEKIKPLLAKERGPIKHKFAGVLAPQERHTLLGQAKCLLHPTLAPETSSLVAMEALAEGTPVIAYRSGALPEIVEDGVSGFLVESVEEMADAIRRIHAIRPEACKEIAARRFSRERMVHQYFDLYEDMVRYRKEKLYA